MGTPQALIRVEITQNTTVIQLSILKLLIISEWDTRFRATNRILFRLYDWNLPPTWSFDPSLLRIFLTWYPSNFDEENRISTHHDSGVDIRMSTLQALIRVGLGCGGQTINSNFLLYKTPTLSLYYGETNKMKKKIFTRNTILHFSMNLIDDRNLGFATVHGVF